MKVTTMAARILIINQVSLNLGDAAILLGNIRVLQDRYGDDAEILVFDSEAENAAKYRPWAKFRQALFHGTRLNVLERFVKNRGYGHWNMRIRYKRYRLALALYRINPILARLLVQNDKFEAIKAYACADLIVSAGGTYLVENYNLEPRALELRMAQATGGPVVLYTQTLGPYRKRKNRDLLTPIFSASSLILLRDERSRDHLIDLELDGKNIRLAADAAFLLARPSGASMGQKSKAENRLNIAISVRSMQFFHSEKSKNYCDAIRVAVVVAVEKFDADVAFLSTCQGIPEYWTNDAETAEKIYSELPDTIKPYVSVDHNFRQPEELVDTYKSFDAVIATRMHAAILSLCAGIPTLGIAYEFKLDELFSNLGMSEMVVSMDELTEIKMEQYVHRLLTQISDYEPKVVAAAMAMRESARLVCNYLPDLTER